MKISESKMKDKILTDTFFLMISIVFAVYIVRSGIVENLLHSFSEFEYLGSFFAGLLFTSVFTTAPAIVILGELMQETPILEVALIGGLGAMVGDYLLFKFVRHRILDDVNSVLKYSGIRRFPAVFKGRLGRWFLPLLGSIIIVSPLPDELGLTLMGLSKIKDRDFLPIIYLLNTTGIVLVGLVANLVV